MGQALPSPRLAALAAVIWWYATRLSLSSPYGLGPDAAPKVVAGGLALLAVANFIITAWRGALPHREAGDFAPSPGSSAGCWC